MFPTPRRFQSGFVALLALTLLVALCPSARGDQWFGDEGDGIWQVNGGNDWNTPIQADQTGALSPYIDGDPAIFGLTLTSLGYSVKIDGTVSPESVEFIYGNYTFSGAGVINTPVLLVQGSAAGTPDLTWNLTSSSTITTTNVANGGQLTMSLPEIFAGPGAPPNPITGNLVLGSVAVGGGGGTLSLVGPTVGSGAQEFNNVTINPGESVVGISGGGGSGASVALTYAGDALTRNTGGTVDFELANGGFITVNQGADAFTEYVNGGVPVLVPSLGGWATVNGTDWTQNFDSNVIALSPSQYTNDTWESFNSGPNIYGLNTTVTQSSQQPASSFTGTLRFNNAGAFTVGLSGGNGILTGGILVTSNVGSFNNKISGGLLTSGNRQDLIVIQNNIDGSLTIDSGIINGGSIPIALTKSGPGALILTGNTSDGGGDNTYSGGTYINGGTLVVDNASGSGTGSGAVIVGFNSDAILAGSGAIGGPVTIFQSGRLDPGNGPTNPGTLTINNNLNLGDYSNLDYVLNAANTGGTVAAGNSLTRVNGQLTINPGLSVSVTPGANFSPGVHTLFAYSSLNDNTDNFGGWNLSTLSLHGADYYSFSIDTANKEVDLNIGDLGAGPPQLVNGGAATHWQGGEAYSPGIAGLGVNFMDYPSGTIGYTGMNYPANASWAGNSIFPNEPIVPNNPIDVGVQVDTKLVQILGASNTSTAPYLLNISGSDSGPAGPVLVHTVLSTAFHNNMSNTVAGNLQFNLSSSQSPMMATAALLGPVVNVNISIPTNPNYPFFTNPGVPVFPSDPVYPSSGAGSVSPYVVEEQYDPTMLPGGVGAENALASQGAIFLADLVPTGPVNGFAGTPTFVNAVAGNYDSGDDITSGLAQPTYLGSFGAFWAMELQSDPNLTLQDLDAAWGVDTADHVVWSVVDYDAQFVPLAVTPVPEPASLSMLGIAALAMMRRRRR